MNRISAIVTKELRLFASDKQQLFFGFLMPLAIIAMMVGAFGGGQPLNITGYVLDMDNSTQSAALIDGLDRIAGINLRVLDATEAAARLERSDIASYLVIPEGFAQGIAVGDVSLRVQRRGNGGSDGQIFSSFAVAVASDLAADAQQHRNVLANLDALGLTYDAAVVSSVLDEFRQAAADQPRVSLVMDSAGERGEGASFFLPGIVAMFALFTVALGSENIVAERKNGTLERLMTTQLSKAELLSGKFLAFGVRTLLQITLLFAIGWIWFGLFTPSTFAQTLLFSVAVAGAGAAFGLLVSAIARSQEQAVWGSVIITNVSAMLGGSFVAIDPDSIIGKLGRLTLNYHANVGYRAMVGAGVGFESPEVWQSFVILLGAAIVLLLLAIPAFRVRGDA